MQAANQAANSAAHIPGKAAKNAARKDTKREWKRFTKLASLSSLAMWEIQKRGKERKNVAVTRAAILTPKSGRRLNGTPNANHTQKQATLPKEMCLLWMVWSPKMLLSSRSSPSLHPLCQKTTLPIIKNTDERAWITFVWHPHKHTCIIHLTQTRGKKIKTLNCSLFPLQIRKLSDCQKWKIKDKLAVLSKLKIEK